MKNSILIAKYIEYGTALLGLGDITGNTTKFMLHPQEFKLIMFTGGEDVDPAFYGDTSPDNMCSYNTQRDKTEKILFNHALKHNIPMVGICRGIQFLNVMAGGKLVHHMNGHNNGYHDFGCQKDDKIRRVNSLHHQMVIPPKDALIVGWSVDKLANGYFGDEDKIMKWPGPEVEAVIYPTIRACGVQYHPEMMESDTEGHTFFYNMVAHLLDHPLDVFTRIYTGRMAAINVV